MPPAKRISATAAVAVLALIGALLAAVALAPSARADVPGPPSGWTTVFSDDFNGAAGSGPSSSWMYDTGPGSNFGTGEIETMTNSSSNVHLDGNEFFSVSESQVGAATWQAAVDHNFSIIFDLAMGGGYPNGVCNCTTPTSATTSGGTMSVAYVAAYETSGSGTTGPSGPTGQITGYGGLCVDDRGAVTTDFNPVQVYTCNGTAAQQWTVVEAGSTLHALGKCLDINGGGTADGTTVDLYGCNDTAAQVWEPQSDGALYNPQSNKCLDDTGWSTTPGTQLEIWDCTGNANQSWTLP